ncbi:uncharacterized protein [Anoplolepis gracilipes]|uniref:uncharacterized protein n=1 Tax=Anoplolepis gracilipes TaxID=354296 RepID=UPI003B9E304C
MGITPFTFRQLFTKLPTNQRIDEIKKRKLCINCMKSKSHQAKRCTSNNCKTCGLKHNTLLHRDKQDVEEHSNTKDSTLRETQSAKHTTESTLVTHSLSSSDKNYVLLSTALINAFDKDDNKLQCRVLLDSGSQANLVTRDFVSNLRINTKQSNMSIVCINQITTSSNESMTIKIGSRYNKFQTTIECLVTDKITDVLPSFHISKSKINIPKNLQLADPQFNALSQVQMLIGSDLFWRLVCLGQIKSSFHGPTIQKAQFGWVIAGAINNEFQQHKGFRHVQVNNVMIIHGGSDADLDHALTRFWQLESYFSRQNPMTPAECECEEQFLHTVKRNNEGHFIVTLPIRDGGLTLLGESQHSALTRFKYIDLKHMQVVDQQGDNNTMVEFYLPHHAVLKESSTTTKLRVVFDASAKSDSGVSLNDILLIRPIVQSDLISVLLKFRMFKYVFTADITKMYRQILVDGNQTSLERIFWKERDNEPIKAYELKSLTYGTASASYIATRCLKYLAESNQHRFPVGSEAIINDFYMDNLLTGADSIEEAIIKRDQIISILESELWKSQINWDSSVLMHIHTQWMQFRTQLNDINKIKINRFIFSGSEVNKLQLHGFADASQAAYGACCYIRARDEKGPEWLQLHEDQWPKSQAQYSVVVSEQVTKTFVIKQECAILNTLIAKYSKLPKLVRVLAYVFCYINNCKPTVKKRVALLTSKEYEYSLRFICKFVQQQQFGNDIKEIKKSKFASNSKLSSLNPFIDDEGMLQVGGRLKHTELAYDAKYSILLPKDHTITRLIIHNEHIKNIHCGIQATIYAVRNKFWPIAAKTTTRDIIKKCVTCWKNKPITSENIMSDLLSTRAVHIELVADLTTESFLSAFKRFVARRGKVVCMYSNNGTNFIGAAKELNELYELFTKKQTQLKLSEFFVEHRIEWRTIPPNAPHFGGIWEAAIKSAKYHMKRVIGDAALNYDEMSTLFAEIEAILNSRLISQLSSDPNDIR